LYRVLFWRKLMVFRYFPSYRSCIAFIKPAPLVTATVEGARRVAAGLVVVAGVGTVVAPD
jgi:hypothetical protein